MKRALILAALLCLPVAAILAQPPPGGTPPAPPPVATIDSNAGGPPTDNNAPPPDNAQATPAAPIATVPAAGEQDTTTEGEVSDETVDDAPSDAIPLLIRLRADLDLMADTALGVGQRPPGWSNLTSTDIDNPDLLLLTRLDLEILAGALFSADSRPDGWFGAVQSTELAIARDVRHDIELLADEVFDASIGRPAGWNGDNPLYRCNRATQALVELLAINGLFSIEVDPAAADYCTQVEIAAARFAEINLLANPTLNGSATAANAAPGDGTITSEFAVGFLDRSASLRLGVIPIGTTFTPVARSYAQFSNMMLIQGDNFEFFVDYQFTNVTPEAFDALPDVDSITINPGCGADWCEVG